MKNYLEKMRSKVDKKAKQTERKLRALSLKSAQKGGDTDMSNPITGNKLTKTGKIAMVVSSLLVLTLVAISLISAYSWVTSVVKNWQEIEFARTNPDLVKTKREEWTNILKDAKNVASKKENSQDSK